MHPPALSNAAPERGPAPSRVRLSSAASDGCGEATGGAPGGRAPAGDSMPFAREGCGDGERPRIGDVVHVERDHVVVGAGWKRCSRDDEERGGQEDAHPARHAARVARARAWTHEEHDRRNAPAHRPKNTVPRMSFRSRWDDGGRSERLGADGRSTRSRARLAIGCGSGDDPLVLAVHERRREDQGATSRASVWRLEAAPARRARRAPEVVRGCGRRLRRARGGRPSAPRGCLTADARLAPG